MSIKYPIKIVFDHDEQEYLVFIEGIKGVEGRGSCEASAIADFKRNYERLVDEKETG